MVDSWTANLEWTLSKLLATAGVNRHQKWFVHIVTYHAYNMCLILPGKFCSPSTSATLKGCPPTSLRQVLPFIGKRPRLAIFKAIFERHYNMSQRQNEDTLARRI